MISEDGPGNTVWLALYKPGKYWDDSFWDDEELCVGAKWSGDGFDLTGTLSLVPPFQYKKGKVTVDLLSAQFEIEVKQSQLEFFEGQAMETSVTANVAGQELHLLGITDAGYNKTKGISGDSSLELLEGCKVESKFKAVYLKEGTPFKFKLKEGLIKWLKGGGIKIATDDEDE